MNGLMAPLSFKIKPGDHLNFSFSDKKTQQLFNDNRISPDGYHAMPYIKSGDQVFYDSTLVTLASLQKDPIEYTTDTTNGVIHIYEDPILLKENAVIFFRNHFGNKVSEWLKAKFFRKTTGIILKLETDYENQYAASGKDALVDGLIGSYDFRDGLWQGFQGRDLNLTLEFPVIRTVRSVDIRFLQDQRSWILMPTEVEFLISEDGRHFETIEIVKNNISKNETNSVIENFKLDQNMRCRMIKIIAKNPGPMPEDHPGAGGQSWLFSDEIIIN